MDIGLYKLKYPTRKILTKVLPLFRNTSPNAISWSIIPIGIATAACYYYSNQYPALLLAGAFLIFLKMLVSTIDGYVAVSYNKCSPEGEIINRLTPELYDAMVYIPILLLEKQSMLFSLLVISIIWLSTFSGLVGYTCGRQGQSVGPAGQTDRLMALILFSLIDFIGYLVGYKLEILEWFLWWCIFGGIVTVINRIYRTLNPQTVTKE